MTDWQFLCIEEQVYTRQSFYRAAENLRDKGIIEISGDCVKLSPLSLPVSL